MTKRLWIDDLRPSPAGWEWVKTSKEAIHFLWLNYGQINEISFDHDLGGIDTSRKVILWMCENDYPWPMVIRVHTSNPPGRDWLEGMINRYAPPGTLKKY